MISFFGNDDSGLGRKKRYRPDPMGRLGQGDWVDDDEPDPFGRIRGTVHDDRPDTKGLSTIAQSVGMEGKNDRADVAVAETLLHQNGVLDTNQTKGPTGYFGTRADQAIRRFQKDKGLKVDGLMLPNGPTIQALQAGTKKAPTLITPGLATAAPAKPKVPAASIVPASTLNRASVAKPNPVRNAQLPRPAVAKAPVAKAEPAGNRLADLEAADAPYLAAAMEERLHRARKPYDPPYGSESAKMLDRLRGLDNEADGHALIGDLGRLRRENPGIYGKLPSELRDFHEAYGKVLDAQRQAWAGRHGDDAPVPEAQQRDWRREAYLAGRGAGVELHARKALVQGAVGAFADAADGINLAINSDHLKSAAQGMREKVDDVMRVDPAWADDPAVRGMKEIGNIATTLASGELAATKLPGLIAKGAPLAKRLAARIDDPAAFRRMADALIKKLPEGSQGRALVNGMAEAVENGAETLGEALKTVGGKAGRFVPSGETMVRSGVSASSAGGGVVQALRENGVNAEGQRLGGAVAAAVAAGGVPLLRRLAGLSGPALERAVRAMGFDPGALGDKGAEFVLEQTVGYLLNRVTKTGITVEWEEACDKF